MGLLSLTREFEDAVDRWDGVVGKPNPASRGVERLRVFENDFVENWLATAHPVFPGLWAIPGSLVFGWLAVQWSPGWTLVPLWVVGFLAWSLLEYVLHRWLFHRRPSSWRFDKVQMYMLHGYHHDYPNDPWRLVAPPVMAWPITAIIYVVCISVLGWEIAAPFLSGAHLGYLSYDWTHYYEHHAKPKNALGKWLRKLHSLHHFDDAEYNHGISGPLWDFAFFTFRAKSRKQAERDDTHPGSHGHTA